VISRNGHRKAADANPVFADLGLIDALQLMTSFLSLIFCGLLVLVIARLLRSISANRAQLERLRREAVTDPLTGLGNRRGLYKDLPDRVAAASDGHPLAVVIFDLDGFKAYNDSYGHTAGDRMLTRIAFRLQTLLTETEVAYRLGGDEFCALVEIGGRDPERVAAELAAGLTQHGLGFDVTASHGCAIAPTDGTAPHSLLRRADRLMYERKQQRAPFSAHRSVVSRSVPLGKTPLRSHAGGNIFAS
jgi:diguanylate cyclase (GGDEF)-like protein